jgi:ABC-2 type transport system permease protein
VIRLVRAELLKITTARLGIAMFVLAIAIDLIGTGFTLAFAGREIEGQLVIDPIDTVADTREVVFGAAQVALFALLLGATSTTTEHRYGTIGGTFLVTPVRWRVVLAKVQAAAFVGLLFGLAGALASLGLAAVWFAVQGDSLPFGASVLGAVPRVAVAAMFSAAVGGAIGASLTSQVWAVVAVIAWRIVIEPLVGALLPAVAPYLPFSGVEGSIAPVDPTLDLFGPWTAAALAAVYVATATAVGVALTERRDVEGR